MFFDTMKLVRLFAAAGEGITEPPRSPERALGELWAMPQHAAGPRALYLSLIPPEEAMIYHACPGGLAARLVVPGAPRRCTACSWKDAVSEEGLVVRRLGPGFFRRLRQLRPGLLLVDGPEPAMHDWVLELPARVEEEAGYRPFMALRSAGLVAAERLREAARRGYDLLLFEYIPHVDSAVSVAEAAEALDAAYDSFRVLEVLVPCVTRERSGFEQLVSGLAPRYPRAGLHLHCGEVEAPERLARLVEKLRERRMNAYLHPDDAMLFSDTLCPRCGAVLVSRKPWGTRIHALRGEDGVGVCPRCGAEAPLLLCGEHRRGRALHREVVIW